MISLVILLIDLSSARYCDPTASDDLMVSHVGIPATPSHKTFFPNTPPELAPSGVLVRSRSAQAQKQRKMNSFKY